VTGPLYVLAPVRFPRPQTGPTGAVRPSRPGLIVRVSATVRTFPSSSRLAPERRSSPARPLRSVDRDGHPGRTVPSWVGARRRGTFFPKNRLARAVRPAERDRVHSPVRVRGLGPPGRSAGACSRPPRRRGSPRSTSRVRSRVQQRWFRPGVRVGGQVRGQLAVQVESDCPVPTTRMVGPRTKSYSHEGRVVRARWFLR